MKIAVLGYSGSGKSTFAKNLAHFYQMDCLHLDTVQFLPQWVERPKEEARSLVKTFLDTHTDWVIDGNYSRFYQERRLEEANQIFFFDFPIHTCLAQAWKRSRMYRNTSRPDMTQGCKEKFDFDFVWWIIHGGRSAATKQHYQAILNQYPSKCRIFHSLKEVENYLSQLEGKSWKNLASR